MHGNRDFLVGDALLAHCGVHAPARSDRARTHSAARIVLTHGDALCLDDIEYQRFRADGARPGLAGRGFLARPLAERRAMARAMRDAERSTQAQLSPALWADVDAAAALQLARCRRQRTRWCTATRTARARGAAATARAPCAERLGSRWRSAPRAEVLRWQRTACSPCPRRALDAERA